jgi:uncharacterized protein YycO
MAANKPVPIALEPKGGGGKCIGPDALETADLIVSTAQGGISKLIRVATISKVSHAALYIGGSDVIEAIGSGVERRNLKVALSDDALAVVYRSPLMTPEIASSIVKFAGKQVGLPYSVTGAGLSAILCRKMGSPPTSFFCSELVMEAYRQGGLPLTTRPSTCITPDDTVWIAEHKLSYVGHLLGEPSLSPILHP